MNYPQKITYLSHSLRIWCFKLFTLFFVLLITYIFLHSFKNFVDLVLQLRERGLLFVLLGFWGTRFIAFLHELHEALFYSLQLILYRFFRLLLFLNIFFSCGWSCLIVCDGIRQKNVNWTWTRLKLFDPFLYLYGRKNHFNRWL